MSSGAVRAEKERGCQPKVLAVVYRESSIAWNRRLEQTLFGPWGLLELLRLPIAATCIQIRSPGGAVCWLCFGCVLVARLVVMADAIDVIASSKALCTSGTSASRHVLDRHRIAGRNRQTPPKCRLQLAALHRSAAQDLSLGHPIPWSQWSSAP